MNKPVRYIVYTEKHPNGYTFRSLWKQSENIIKIVAGAAIDNLALKVTIGENEYKINKELLNSNDRLNHLRTNLEKLKHLMCTCTDESIKEEYSRAREEYESSPLVINFKISEEKLNGVIRNLIEDINTGL